MVVSLEIWVQCSTAGCLRSAQKYGEKELGNRQEGMVLLVSLPLDSNLWLFIQVVKGR